MYKVEFHVHSSASKDSILNKYFILMMAKMRKIDCIAITDHNEVKFALNNKAFFEKHNLAVIVGEEIFTEDGEVIGLFLNKKIEPMKSAKDTIKEIKKQGGFVYIPHPYDEKRVETVLSEKVLQDIVNDVDLIEKHNGRNVSKDFSLMQEQIAEKYNLRKITGSDAHTFYELGRNYCLVDSFERDKLLKSIDNCVFHEKNCLKIAHQNTKFVKLFKMLMRGDIDGIFRIINRKFKKRK